MTDYVIMHILTLVTGESIYFNLLLFRGQMISGEDCEFIKKFEVAHSEQKQAILTNEGHQVGYDYILTTFVSHVVII